MDNKIKEIEELLNCMGFSAEMIRDHAEDMHGIEEISDEEIGQICTNIIDDDGLTIAKLEAIDRSLQRIGKI